MDLGVLFAIIVGSIFINNFVFARFFGLCSFIGVSQKLESSVGMGLAVSFVMTLASSITWVIYTYLFVPFHMEYLNTVAFILVIAALVQFVELVMRKSAPNMFRMLGVFLPLITTNCAVLAVTLVNVQEKYNFIGATLNGLASAIGYTMALLLLAGIREQLINSKIPKPFRGVSMAFMCGGLLALAFMGFNGMKI